MGSKESMNFPVLFFRHQDAMTIPQFPPLETNQYLNKISFLMVKDQQLHLFVR